MLGLLDQMEAENPEDPSLAPTASVYPAGYWAGRHNYLQLDNLACRLLGSGPVPMLGMYKCSKS